MKKKFFFDLVLIFGISTVLGGYNQQNHEANAQQIFSAIPDSESAYVDQLISAFDQRTGSEVPGGVAFDVHGPLWGDVEADVLQLSPSIVAANTWPTSSQRLPAVANLAAGANLAAAANFQEDSRKTQFSSANRPNANLQSTSQSNPTAAPAAASAPAASGPAAAASRSRSIINFQFCEHCGRVFHRLDLFREHLKRHDGVFHRCTQCSKLFKGRPELRRHISETHSASKRRFQCDNCPSNFSRAAALRKHKEKSHPTTNETQSLIVDPSRPIVSSRPIVDANSADQPSAVDLSAVDPSVVDLSAVDLSAVDLSAVDNCLPLETLMITSDTVADGNQASGCCSFLALIFSLAYKWVHKPNEGLHVCLYMLYMFTLMYFCCTFS